MIKYLEFLVDAANAAISFLVSIITGTIRMVAMIPQTITFLRSAVSFLPSFFTVFATAFITVCVIYTLVGRSRS